MIDSGININRAPERNAQRRAVGGGDDDATALVGAMAPGPSAVGQRYGWQ
ncbi:MAG: hypothetical protein IAE78_01105 [Myxococcus sp.]|nr:hypothetical protein [Myxococcus sp.]